MVPLEFFTLNPKRGSDRLFSGVSFSAKRRDVFASSRIAISTPQRHFLKPSASSATLQLDRMRLTLEQLRALASSVGFPDDQLDTAAAIAMAESGGDPNAYNTEGSYGLWQIFISAHPNYDTQSLFDPTYNAQAALAISNNGTNWKPWTTYGYDRSMHFVGWGNGYYLEYMPVTPTPSTASGSKFNMKSALLVTTAAAFGLGVAWWLTRTPREKRRIRRMLPA